MKIFRSIKTFNIFRTQDKKKTFANCYVTKALMVMLRFYCELFLILWDWLKSRFVHHCSVLTIMFVRKPKAIANSIAMLYSLVA